MATPTFTLLNHQLLTTADTSTGWNDLTTQDTDIKVEGAASMSGVFRADGEQGYYDAGSAPVTAAGKTVRGWIFTNNIAYMGTAASDGYKLLMYDGSTTELKTIFGSDTYPGGWFNYIWDCDEFTTLTLANVRRWGVEAGHASAAKNVVNTWMDVIRYLDGYSMVGGTSGDKVRMSNIAALDKTSAYGIVSEVNGVFFATGTIQFGTGPTTHYFEMDGQVLVFTEQHVAEGLYSLSGVGSGTNVLIQNSVLRSTGAADNTRFAIDMSDTNLATAVVKDNLISRAGAITYKSGQTMTGNTYDDCGQITPAGAVVTGSVVKNYGETADTAPTNTSALIWNETSDPGSYISGSSFIMGTVATHAIEFGTSSPTTINLTDITFSGYGTSNNANDSMLHIKRTSGTVTINLSNVTVVGGGSVTYRTDGATVTLVASNTLELTGLQNPTEIRVYNANTTTEIAGQENVTSGTFSTSIDAASYPTVDISVISLGYQNLRITGVSMSTDRSIPVFQVLDRQYANP